MKDTYRRPLEYKRGTVRLAKLEDVQASDMGQESGAAAAVRQAAQAGRFEGYASIFNMVDYDGDIVRRGAFAESLRKRMPVLLWQHDTKAPIGKFTSVKEDAKGLKVQGQLSMKGQGLEAYDLLKLGALDGLSVGFVAKEAERDPKTGARIITKADLMEISLVTFPANDMARVEQVKHWSGMSVKAERDFENFLRGAGVPADLAEQFADAHDADFELDEDDIASLVREMKARTYRLQAKMAY